MCLCFMSSTNLPCHISWWTVENVMSIKERYTTTVDGKLVEELKILAIRKKLTANLLLEEAIADLLEKYGVIQKKEDKPQYPTD